MSNTSYAPLYKELQQLIAQADQILDRDAGVKAAVIRQWITDAHECLALLEDRLPTTLADFRRLRVAFRVDEDEAFRASASAYRPESIDEITGEPVGADVLLDFRFDNLRRAVALLKRASRKLEREGHSTMERADTSAALPSELRDRILPLVRHFSLSARGPRADIRLLSQKCN